MNKLIRPIKKALAQKYGYKNVSVKNGSGTAWGWVEARIKINEPKDKGEADKIYEEATRISREALKKEGLEFYTYGINDTEEFLLQLDY